MSFLDTLKKKGFNKYFLSSLKDTAVNWGQKTGEFLGMQPIVDKFAGIIAPHALAPEELQYVEELQKEGGGIREYGQIFAGLANLYMMGRVGGAGKISSAETLKGLSKITPDLIQAVRLKQAARLSKYAEAGVNVAKGSAIGTGFMGAQAFQEDEAILPAMGQGAIFGGALGLGAEGLSVGVSKVVEKIALKKAINSIVHRGAEFTPETLDKLHPLWKFQPKWIETAKVKTQIDPAELDRTQVEKYKEQIWSGKKVEPVIALKDGSKLEVLDGDHRLQAMKETGQTQVAVFEGRINPQAGFIGPAGKPELPERPKFGDKEKFQKNEAEVMRDELLSKKRQEEGADLTASQKAMFDKNKFTKEGGQQDLLAKGQVETRPIRKDMTPEEAWDIDYVEDHEKLKNNITELDKQLKEAKGADKADIEIKIRDLTNKQTNLEEDFINKYQPMEDQRLAQEKTGQIDKMIETMNPDEQKYAANLVDELEEMGRLKKQHSDNPQMLKDIENRTVEIKDELSQIGKKSSLKAMPEKDVARTMFGEEPAKDIIQSRDGELNRAIRDTGLDPVVASDDEMIKALNEQGYSFDDAGEIADMMKLEREGLLVSPEEQSAVKMNEWLNDEVFNKMSEQEKFAAVTGKTKEQFMREEGVDKGALARAIKRLGGIKTDKSIGEEISSNVPFSLRNNKTGSFPDEIVSELRGEGFFFEDSDALMEALWELPGQVGAGKAPKPARQIISDFGGGKVIKAFDTINKGYKGVAGIAKGQRNIFDELSSDYISAAELRRSAAARRRIPIIKVGDIPENQLEFLNVARKSEISGEMTRALKADIAETGKIKTSTFQALKDELYGKKAVTVDQAIKEEFVSYKRLQAEMDKAGTSMDDGIALAHEQKIADRILSTARGDATVVIDRLENAGVRPEIIKSLRINNQYPLNTAVRIKKEPNGEISTVISQDILDHIQKSYKRISKAGEDLLDFSTKKEKIFTPEMQQIMKENGVNIEELSQIYNKKIYDMAFESMEPEAPRWIKKWSIEGIKNKIANAFTEFEVQQQYFKRIGLKEVLYDPIRMGERQSATMRNEVVSRLKPVFRGLSKKERQEITIFFAGKQGKAKDIVKAGHKIVTFEKLNDRQKEAVIAWRQFNREIAEDIMKQADQHGIELKQMDWYFPLYSKRNIEKIGGVNLMDERAIRKEPFFRSLREREEAVDFNLYEKDAWELANAYINGASRFLKVGEKTLPVKYLVDSEEFAKIVGAEDQGKIRAWLKEITTPSQAEGTVGRFLASLRRGSYRAYLGLNPRTVMKQVITWMDAALVEGVVTQRVSKETRQLGGKLGFSTVTERVPDISLVDVTNKYDRAILYGITSVDKSAAGGIMNKLMSRELEVIKKTQGKITQKDIRQALIQVSDTVDLVSGGVTPSQRPNIYNSEWGKLGLMFTSTLNSRLQYYIQQGVKGIRTKDAMKIAKVTGAFILAAYAETAISRLSFEAEDSYDMAKEISKTAAGNIPLVGALMFAADSGKYEASAALANLTDAVEKTSTWGKTMDAEDLLAAMARWGEVGGIPKQIRKSIEGFTEYEDLRHIIGGKNIDYKTEQKNKGGISPSLKMYPGAGSNSRLNPGWQR